LRKSIRDEVRVLYNFACGYCGVAEADAGGELTIYHFQPRSAGGDDQISNLVYCCFRCNVYKGALLPEQVLGDSTRRLLHPRLENTDVHLAVDPVTGLVEGMTETARYHILALQLNRPALIAHRQQKALTAQLETVAANTHAELEQLDTLLRDLMEYLDLLSRWSDASDN
jgi:hypothetical protein